MLQLQVTLIAENYLLPPSRYFATTGSTITTIWS